MAKGTKAGRDFVELDCPCCQAALKVDTQTGAVISYKAKEKPPAIEDLSTAVARLKGEAGRREEAFQKSFAEHKTHQQVLGKKFDELLKQAKATPDLTPPKKDIDFD